MKKALLLLLSLILILSMSGCSQKEAVSYGKEESGGSGFGVVKKSAITLSDLYFFSVNTTRGEVLEALGSPQEYMIADGGAVTYRLDSGATLKLTYNQRDVVKTALFTDENGKEQDLFSYLVELGVLKSVGGVAQDGNTGVGQQATPEKEPDSQEQNQDENQKEESSAVEQGGYFSSLRYSLDIAEKLLKEGAKREMILSALGKPNSFGSVSYQKGSYIIDIYIMEDGSIYQLDYGYTREKLRAVRSVKGSRVSAVLGSWGQQERPQDFYYNTKNLNLFHSLKKGMKPSELYARLGAPDWYEGNERDYRDAYQLASGSILYLDFGNGHSGLVAATLQKADGTQAPYALR